MAKITLIPHFYTYNCDNCDIYCEKPRKDYYTAKKREQTLFFCSQSCKNEYHGYGSKNCKCANCGEVVKRDNRQIAKTKHSFCNKSCAATFNNKLKRKSRRSKIEAKFYNMLEQEFPSLDLSANDKTMLDGYEVDVAIPELQLAIEWNGIVHFKPIYGQTKLDKIQGRDAEKLKIASNKNINLIVISDLVSDDARLKEAFNDVKVIIEGLI